MIFGKNAGLMLKYQKAKAKIRCFKAGVSTFSAEF